MNQFFKHFLHFSFVLSMVAVAPAQASMLDDRSVPTAVPVQDSLWVRAAEQFGRHADFSVSPSSQSRVLAQPEVERQLKWVSRHTSYLYNVTRRSEPYAFHIVQRCLARGLPAELGLVPIVESSFDVYAYSPGRASGLWQFMPSTGKHFGLEQNWWVDERRDPVASTEAALDYLEKLNKRFDSWLLAMAAYNAGPARVSRAIRANEKKGLPTDYWSLRLPEETRKYVPRLLALREALMSPEQYGARIFPVPNAPYFAQVNTQSQLDLAQAARLADVDMETLYRLNPNLSRWATPPEGPHQLYLPYTKHEQFKVRLADTPKQDRLQWQRYIVKPGDTLSQIAARHATDMKTIRSVNELNSSSIRAGQALVIPIASENSAHYVMSDSQRSKARMRGRSGKAKYVHTVRPGDSWWTIARKHKVSTGALVRWNGKAPKDVIRPGQKLVVWKKLSDSELGTVRRSVIYKVKTGDNLSRIASRYKVSVNQLLSWNNISTDKYLKPGQPLKIKVAVAGGV